MHFKVTAHPFKAQSDLDSLLSGMKGLLFTMKSHSRHILLTQN